MKDCSVYKTKLTMSAHRRLDPVASGERWHTHVVSVRRGIALSGFKAAPPSIIQLGGVVRPPVLSGSEQIALFTVLDI